MLGLVCEVAGGITLWLPGGYSGIAFLVDLYSRPTVGVGGCQGVGG